MDQINIAGVAVRPIQKIADERGQLMYFMKNSSSEFKQFGEVYFSLTYQNIIKGWKKHLEMTQNFICPFGEIKLVIYDDRVNSTTKGKIDEFKFGFDNYKLITIPPGLWYSFQALSTPHAIICNLTDVPHRPGESIAIPLESAEIPYQWKK